MMISVTVSVLLWRLILNYSISWFRKPKPCLAAFWLSYQLFTARSMIYCREPLIVYLWGKLRECKIPSIQNTKHKLYEFIKCSHFHLVNTFILSHPTPCSNKKPFTGFVNIALMRITNIHSFGMENVKRHFLNGI